MTASIVMAAGASTRLGQPKQLVRLAGMCLLERAVQTAHEAGCSPIVVVLGAHANQILAVCDLSHASVLVNEGWSEGMASSIRLGVRSVRNADGVVLMTCDQPGVTAAHLQNLMNRGCVVASRYAARHGVPAFFPAANFPELLVLRGDEGARELLRGAEAIELAGGELDVDTVDDLAKAELLFH